MYFLKVKDYQAKKVQGVSDPEKMPKFDQGMENGLLVLEKKIPAQGALLSARHDVVIAAGG